MLFNSLVFFLFLAAMLLLYWTVAKNNIRFRNLLLLAGSYFFYGWWDWRFLSLLIFSSALDFFIGIQLHKAENKSTRKLLIGGSLLANLGLLCTFKYFDFFSHSLAAALAHFDIQLDAVTLNWVLPLGISFYTFQTLSYTLDLYRKKIAPTRDPVAFFAFVSFFPQILAGPIERAGRLLPQFQKKARLSYHQLRESLSLLLWGLFKKVVVADNLARYVDEVYANSNGQSSGTIALATVLFTMQLYCDFSGYSNMARGIARLFGFRLSVNFREPFFANSLQELWRRWHVTLTSWFRDYVYIPMGGNRISVLRWSFNVLLVFTLVGVWHDAKWTYVFWGLFTGVIIVVEAQILKWLPAPNKWRKVAGRIYTLAVFSLTLILIRAENIEQASDLFVQLLRFDASPTGAVLHFNVVLSIVLTAVVMLADRYHIHPQKFARLWIKKRYRWTLQYLLILLIILFGNIGSEEFFYFMF